MLPMDDDDNIIGNDVSEFDGEPDTHEPDTHEPDEQDGEPMGSHDLSDDAEALASAGHGMDEDYRPDAHLDAFYEERNELPEPPEWG